MLLSTSLVAALGIWNFNLNELVNATSAFWISMTIAWTVSMYLAGFIAALSSRSHYTVEGMLNALAACSGTYLLFGMFFLLFAPSALDTLLSSANPQFYLRIFLGDILAFAVGIYGGVVGAHFEQRSMESFKGGKKIVPYST
jgi:hypothetical protein